MILKPESTAWPNNHSRMHQPRWQKSHIIYDGPEHTWWNCSVVGGGVQSSKDFSLCFISPVEIVKARFWLSYCAFIFVLKRPGNTSIGCPVMLGKVTLEINSQIQWQEFRVEWDRQETWQLRTVRQEENFLGCWSGMSIFWMWEGHEFWESKKWT